MFDDLRRPLLEVRYAASTYLQIVRVLPTDDVVDFLLERSAHAVVRR